MSGENFIDLVTREEDKISHATRINGVAIGIVTSNKDAENTLKIKVKFSNLGKKNETDLVDVCCLYGGKEMGCVFVPEVGTEVVCAFLHGDRSRPIAIGTLCSKEDPPPVKTADGKNNTKMIKTRSGHTLTFHDEENREHLTIESKSGHRISLIDDKDSSKIEIRDTTGNNFIEIDSVQSKITIKSDNNLKLEANEIEIKSRQRLSLNSGLDLIIKGQIVRIN